MQKPSFPASRIAAPIGVFDSGVGGLTVVQALRRLMPAEDLIYLADTARLPYGTKTPQTVTRYALQAAEFLVSKGAKMLVIACNTASAHAAAAVAQAFHPVPVLGVVEAGAERAARATRSGGIVVIATEGTVTSGAFPRKIAKRLSSARVTQISCPLFVALAEEGLGEGPIALSIARDYLKDSFGPESTNDTLLLGCTHFPLLTSTLVHVVGQDVALVDCAQAMAETVVTAMAAEGLATDAPSDHRGTITLMSTDAPQRLAKLAAKLLPELGDSPLVELIDLHPVTKP